MHYWCGKGWPKVACPFRTLVVLHRMWLYLLSMEWLMCGTLFLHISTSLGCSVDGLSLRKNGLDELPRTSSIWDLHAMLRVISRGVPGVATESPSGVLGLRRTTCLLYDGPLLGLGFLNCHLVRMFDMVDRDFFLLISCLCSWFVHCPSFAYFFSS